ncbi:hypothetical protein [Oricola sp.]|uniref:hypothetical protein n=1 Tax=Oricola sp. TaxID=1979950 RepID=UPI0025F66A0C|nr:hypothetical protein [Oricola sp.]MCI5078741.1 hypothetical protein [Oricola sp.]
MDRAVMNREEAIAAVRASAAMWVERASGPKAHKMRVTIEDCGLCNLFRVGREPDRECEGCPVFLATGRKLCAGTPISDAVDIVRRVKRARPQSAEFDAAMADLRAAVPAIKAFEQTVLANYERT